MKSNLFGTIFRKHQRLCVFLLIGALLNGASEAEVIDTFSGDLSAYTLSRVNDSNTSANVSFSIVDGVLRAVYTGSSTYEQVLLLRDDYSLNVGDILLAELTHTGSGWDRDLGIAVGYSGTVPSLGAGSSGDVRTNYVEISYRSNSQVMTYARDGNTNLSSGQAWSAPVDALFIERTGLRDFALGYITDGNAVTVKMYTITTDPAIGTAVGFYADVRASISASPAGLDHLQIIRAQRLFVMPEGQPANTAVLEGGDAAFTAEFASDCAPTVTWYHSADGAWAPVIAEEGRCETDVTYDSNRDVYRADLRILNVTASDEGPYFCDIEASGIGAVQTEPALLAIKRLIAHWTLNTDDSLEGTHYDLAGGFELAGGPPQAFTVGAAGRPQTALQIGPGATSEPLSALFENGLTISLWGRPDETALPVFSDGAASMSAASVQGGQWSHVCLVLDGENAQSYLNGTPVDAQPWPFSTTYEMVLELGHARGTSLFEGAVDDVRLYNHSLTADEVYELYARRTGDGGCVLEYAYALDVSGPEGWPDCRINLHDFAVTAHRWLAQDDQATAFADLLVLADEWLGSGLDTNSLSL